MEIVNFVDDNKCFHKNPDLYHVALDYRLPTLETAAKLPIIIFQRDDQY